MADQGNGKRGERRVRYPMSRELIESVGNFFTGGDNIPWCDREIITGCEREVAEANKGSSDDAKAECLMRVSWALVHSRQPEDVQRGIAMLQSSNGNSPLQMREKLYLLAVGYYRSENFIRSRQLVDRCLEIAPDWRQALTLKKAIEDNHYRWSNRNRNCCNCDWTCGGRYCSLCSECLICSCSLGFSHGA